jgi:ABC-2 type transport system permease protein
MRSFLAFTRKEFTYQLRSGKMMLLGILFVLFGIMNPAIAKITPWLLETMADSLAESGMTVTAVTVTAMDSWVQFFKNIPMALIAFVLLEGSIFTKEYETGTLVLSLTKGLSRYKVVLSKAVVLTMLWSLGYWVCFGVTYGYNAYFWDNSIAQNLWLSVICWWVFGLWIIGLMVLFSVISKSGSTVLVGTGGVVFGCYLLGMIPKIKDYVPTLLTDGNSLIYGTAKANSYTAPLLLTAAMTMIFIASSIPLFSKKKL